MQDMSRMEIWYVLNAKELYQERKMKLEEIENYFDKSFRGMCYKEDSEDISSLINITEKIIEYLKQKEIEMPEVLIEKQENLFI